MANGVVGLGTIGHVLGDTHSRIVYFCMGGGRYLLTNVKLPANGKRKKMAGSLINAIKPKAAGPMILACEGVDSPAAEFLRKGLSGWKIVKDPKQFGFTEGVFAVANFNP